MGETALWEQFASITTAELWLVHRRLKADAQEHLARLDALEARKTELDQRGAAKRSLREQQALARQVADLDRQAEQQAQLLRLIGKQQQLLDHLIWAKESSERWQALQATTPTAMELGWDDLVGAAQDVVGLEAHLDKLLYVLGVPEEERHQSSQLFTIPEAVVADETKSDELVMVREVLDGQTLRIETGETVRYIGVDAPLLIGPLGQPDHGAQEAREANRRLVEGQVVRLDVDAQDKDADGSLWRYVWIGTECINAELIRRGLVYHQQRSPNYRHSQWFAQLEKKARREMRGVWA